jgi:hypothetical protein
MPFVPAPDRPGVEVMPLFRDAHEDVRLERWAAGAEIVLPVPAGMELLVLDGGFREGGESFEPQSWLRLPAGATLKAAAGPTGCKLWVKSGHLARARTIPATAAGCQVRPVRPSATPTGRACRRSDR